MEFPNLLNEILSLEREGKRRVSEAESTALEEIERSRQEAEAILREGDEVFRREKERLWARAEEEIEHRTGRVHERVRAEEKRLRSIAQKNREKTIARLLQWLEEER